MKNIIQRSMGLQKLKMYYSQYRSYNDKLLSLQAYLQLPKPITSDPEAVKRLDKEIRDVAVKAEDEIESKLSDVYLAVHQTLQLKAKDEIKSKLSDVYLAADEDLHQILQRVVKDFESIEVRILDLQITHTAAASSSSLNSDDASSSTPPSLPLEKFLEHDDFEPLNYSNGMPREIVNLVQLRYLAITTTGSLYNFQLLELQKLQTLILSSWMEECPLQLPCDILNLPWLRHVCLDKGSSLYLPNSIKGNLQTLFWLKVDCWETTAALDFTMVPNLKELGIYLEGEMSANTFYNLTQLHQLQILKFEMGRVRRFYLPLCFPPNIKKLSLRNTNLSWEKMDIIGKLSNLEVLKLKEFAFCGPKWEVGGVCFYRLKFLHIVHLDLKHWKASEKNFRVLECLVLRCCYNLKDLPIDMARIRRLRLIELTDCCPSLVRSAMGINQKQKLFCGTDGLVVRHSLTKICSLRYMLEKLSEIQTVDESHLDAKIRDVAVKAEAKIESKLREVYLATSSKGDRHGVEAASRGLRETLEYVVNDLLMHLIVLLSCINLRS
nr:putative late blight resistance protein homolog R1B-14 [Ipomoea batatas]